MSKIINEIDVNGDGQISANEWVDYMLICQNSIKNKVQNNFVEILNKNNIREQTYSNDTLQKRINLLESIKLNVEDLEDVLDMAKRINHERQIKDAKEIKEDNKKIINLSTASTIDNLDEIEGEKDTIKCESKQCVGGHADAQLNGEVKKVSKRDSLV